MFELNTEHCMIKHKHSSYKSPDYTLTKISLWNYRSCHRKSRYEGQRNYFLRSYSFEF